MAEVAPSKQEERAFVDEAALPLDITRPDLFFGLIGPIGTDLKAVASELQAQLRRFTYESEVIKLTSELSQRPNPPWNSLNRELPRDRRYHLFMDAGNCLREFMGTADAMAGLAVLKIFDFHARRAMERIAERERKERNPDRRDEPKAPPRPQAFIIDQLKRPEEVELLRTIYGGRFVAVSVYEPLEARRTKLARMIADSHHAHKTDDWQSVATDLLIRDQEEVAAKWGQQMAKTFPMADIFIDATNQDSVHAELQRAVDLLFDNPFLTPRPHELAMALAHRAGIRSADLGRQVGAAIAMPPTHSIVALGCNEVPRRGGGQYWAGDEPDDRDFRRGENVSLKSRITVLQDTIRTLLQAGWKPPVGTVPTTPSEEANDAEWDAYWNGMHALIRTSSDELLQPSGARDSGPAERLRRRLLVEDIIEFARAVHAEMGAITDAARRGTPVAGGVLYSTTFPCHECARHIVAAGIAEVQYIEPYPKSLVQAFHEDSISIDNRTQDGRVWFHPYVGISPLRFNSFFATTRRQEGNGPELRRWIDKEARPRPEIFDYPQGNKEIDADSRRSELLASNYRETIAANRFAGDFVAKTLNQPPPECFNTMGIRRDRSREH